MELDEGLNDDINNLESLEAGESGHMLQTNPQPTSVDVTAVSSRRAVSLCRKDN
jgi:hypothetical protein